jgi:hypothetical protein
MAIAIQRFLAISKRSALTAVGKCPELCLLLLLFVLAVGFVNPVREIMTGDDGWAYALSVRHLLATGEYRLHNWATANMPTQIYLGALLAHAVGYSFTMLRFSSIILLLVGLIALYHLLRDFNVNGTEASLLTLTVLASPLVLYLSFTFQTDVQFLGWQVLALWLYARALRKESYPVMALASMVAFAAIGTRQFGVASVAALFATWLLFEQHRLRKAPLYLVGLILPLVMTLWQISFGLRQPTFSEKVRLAEESAYLRDLPSLAAEVLWRPTIILQYLGLFLLPLAPLLVVLVRNCLDPRDRNSLHGVRDKQQVSRSSLWLLAAWTVYIAAGVCCGYFFFRSDLLMPSLAWLLRSRSLLEPFFPVGFEKRLVVTILACGFGVALGWLLSQKYLERRGWRNRPPAESFVVLSGLALLCLHLLYLQFYDVYLIQFLPFAVFALGQMLHIWPRWCKVLTAVLCLLMLTVSSLWSRANLAKAEAHWRAAEIARSVGAAPQEIGGNMTWSCYHGAFDEWIADVGGPDATSRYSGSNRMHAAFFNLLNRRYNRAKYVLSSSLPAPSDKNWQLLRRVEYRDNWLRRRSVYVLMRSKSE